MYGDDFDMIDLRTRARMARTAYLVNRAESAGFDVSAIRELWRKYEVAKFMYDEAMEHFERVKSYGPVASTDFASGYLSDKCLAAAVEENDELVAARNERIRLGAQVQCVLRDLNVWFTASEVTTILDPED